MSPAEVDYRERLLPAWWAWLIALALILMLSVAYGAALGRSAGWGVALVSIVVVGLLLIVSAPRIAVGEGMLEAGRARLPLSVVAEARGVSAEEIRALRGPGADARIYTLLRSWSTGGAVLITLADGDDPHPAWLISSRDPESLSRALTGTMGS